MDFGEESSRFDGTISLLSTTTRNMSSSSSTFFSANQSPFFSPRSPATCQLSESTRSEANNTTTAGPPEPAVGHDEVPCVPSNLQNLDRVSSSTGISNTTVSSRGYFGGPSERRFKTHSGGGGGGGGANRMRSCDVFIGLHGRKPSLLRFVNWLRAELEVQGMSCLVSDRARLRNSHKHSAVEKAMDSASFGAVVITSKSFKNPYTVEELRLFSGKKNLVPIFFDLNPSDCLVRDIVEKRGDLWERNGGELWALYGGVEREWREALTGLSRADEWKLEAREGNWRDCILKAVALLATRLGRRSVVDRLTKWREKVEKEEFPFPRNEGFVGRKKELSELEFVLFGDVSGEAERDYFELKQRPRRKKSLVGGGAGKGKGKEPVVWKESEKEIEMKGNGNGRFPRRKRSSKKIVYGKGIACVTGDPGIGKTELLLEFAYKYRQRYKMVLWVNGESRYIRQSYLNLWSFLEVDVGIENLNSSSSSEKNRIRSFEEQEEAAVARIRKELMRNIPFLVVIDNLESEKDWWDRKLVMDLLPRFGGDTHIVISTRLPKALNLEPLRLSYLSGSEAMALMTAAQGDKDGHSIAEIEALRSIEERIGRSTLGLAIVGSILSELPITPSRLLDTTNRMPAAPAAKDSFGGPRGRVSPFLFQLFEVCFSIFDHAEGGGGARSSLATRMVQASGWFAPSSPVPGPLLAHAARHVAADKHSPRRSGARGMIRLALLSLASSCFFSASPYSRKSESEACSMLVRFGLARPGADPARVHVSELVKHYSRRRRPSGPGSGSAPRAVVQAVMTRGTISRDSDHLWAACFLLFGFNHDPVTVEVKVPDLLYLVKEVVLPLSIRTFLLFSRCGPALELLRLCTNALEAAEQAFVAPAEKWLEKSACWRPARSGAQLNPCLWQELALSRAAVLEARAKLMIRGGQFDIADDLIRKTVFIRTSICGQDHPETASARDTLTRITRLLANVQIHTSL